MLPVQRLGLNRRLVGRGGRGRINHHGGQNNYRLARVFHHNGFQPQVPVHEPLKQEVRSEMIVIDGDNLSYIGNDDGLVGVYIAANPLSRENSYFEVEIVDTGILGAIGIGLVPQRYELNRQPGWNNDSIGYHADDGRLFKGNSLHGRAFGPRCYAGDKIGCGIKFENMVDENPDPPKDVVPVFFTKNGKELGKVLAHVPPEGLYPCIGMHSEGEEVRINLDAVWEHSDVILMSIDNYEEEWARLHDVRLNGQLLEYTGRGKSIIDVGLAQAKLPLDTTNHYYEIQIVDPGESCYIAIGLARRDYPKHRHPGWNKGSIAYHADDGKIFIGSGVGDAFGPKCIKGDIMGCGILFPRDYNNEALDSDGSRDSPDVSDDGGNDDYLDLDGFRAGGIHGESDSEDDQWWEKLHSNSGVTVQVFFTRNGKTIGRREIKIPRGGFYPTVGMLSSDEKALVDLRPLTG